MRFKLAVIDWDFGIYYCVTQILTQLCRGFNYLLYVLLGHLTKIVPELLVLVRGKRPLLFLAALSYY